MDGDKGGFGEAGVGGCASGDTGSMDRQQIWEQGASRCGILLRTSGASNVISASENHGPRSSREVWATTRPS